MASNVSVFPADPRLSGAPNRADDENEDPLAQPPALRVLAATLGQSGTEAGASAREKDKVLPLPTWLKRAYFVFPVVLYIPDAIFNFWVYSDGVKRTGNAVFDTGQLVLWACVSLGVVGMAYLLSVLAPWHWGQGHRIQAFFCGLGVLIATAITTWNSLSYRSTDFTAFRTDQWAGQIWPQLQAAGISITMVLVSIAPPFWGLFWAIVQPTETGRTLRQIQESYQEKLLRTQQEAELKAMRAEANARVRTAQLKGMASTAAAAREQAKTIFKKDSDQEQGAAAASSSSASPARRAASQQKAPRIAQVADTEDEDGDLSLDVPSDAADGDGAQTVQPRIPPRIGMRAGDGAGSRSVPKPRTRAFGRAVRSTILAMQRDGEQRTFFTVAARMGAGIQPDDVKAAFEAMREERLNKLRPGMHIEPDPVLDDSALLVTPGPDR